MILRFQININPKAKYDLYTVRSGSYPHNTYLLDANFRLISVQVEGRTATHVQATRRDTNAFFVYPIEELHPINQWWLRCYPIENLGSSTQKSLTESHWEQTLRARDQLIATLDERQIQMAELQSESQQRAIESEIERLTAGIRKLEQSLETAGIDFKPHQSDRGVDLVTQEIGEFLGRMLNRDELDPE